MLDGLRRDNVKVTAYERIFYTDEEFDGKQWNPIHFEGGGSAYEVGGQKYIDLTTKVTDQTGKVLGPMPSSEIASTLYHEGVHTTQPKSMSKREMEIDAYSKTEQWRIDNGMGEFSPGYRKTLPNGKEVPDTSAIEADILKQYPITTKPSGKIGVAPDETVGRTSAGKVVWERADGSRYEAPPVKGDKISGGQQTVPSQGEDVPTCQLKCP